MAIRRGPGGFEQRVCIKRILPAYESDHEFIESFLNEAKTLAAMRHANIVQVLDFGVADGTHYLALELVDGLDLRGLLGDDVAQRVALDPELCCLIAADVCAALDHAHAGGSDRPAVVHRDVSPSNVLISSGGEVKLTDFGIARSAAGRQRTATGIIKGKVPYMPPEYIEHGVFDPRGDLFSLGVMIYEMLAGSRPFDGHSDLDTIRRIVAGHHTHLGAMTRGAPPQLVQWVERLLAVRPSDRFASARAALDALPALDAHRLRRRLGDMVRDQLSRLPTVQDPSPAPETRSEPRAMTPAVYTPGPLAYVPDADESAQLRTHTRAPRLFEQPALPPVPRRTSSRALWVLAFSALCLTLVAALVTQRVLMPEAQVASGDEPPPAEALPALPSTPSADAPAHPRSTPPASDWAPASAPPVAAAPSAPQPVNVVVAEETFPPSDEPPAAPEPLAARAQAPTPSADEGQVPPTRVPTRNTLRRTQSPRRASPVREPVIAAPPAQASSESELRIIVRPYGDVWVDGKRLGQAPVSVKLAAGEHEVGIGDGRPRDRRTVTLRAGESEKLEIQRRDVGEPQD